MAQGLIEDSTLTAIANAIRAKLETSDKMLPGEMASLIEGINTSDYKITYGTKTWSSAATITIGEAVLSHGLGEKPDVVFLLNTTITKKANYQYVNAYLYDADYSTQTFEASTYGSSYSWSFLDGSIADDTNILSIIPYGRYLGTFCWFAMKKVV